MRRRPRAGTGFRVGDGLLAIAVAAVGLVWARAYWARSIAWASGWSWDYDPSRFLGLSPIYQSVRSAVLLMIYVGTTVAAPSGMALVAIRRARRPASPFWRARRPGTMACLAASAVLGLLLGVRSIWPVPWNLNVKVGPPGECRFSFTAPFCDPRDANIAADPFLLAALEMPRVAGLVVGGAWLALAMAGRWRPERSWVDRLGRAIGVFWIASAVHFLFLPLF